MKRLVTLPLVMALCGSIFAASADLKIGSKTWEVAAQSPKVINIFDLTESDLSEIMRGDLPEIAIEFLAHTTLPVSFFLKGDLVKFVEEDEIFKTVEITQTFYARCVGQELVLSTNLTDWKPFLEFITGTVSFSLIINDDGPSFIVEAETNQRS